MGLKDHQRIKEGPQHNHWRNQADEHAEGKRNRRNGMFLIHPAGRDRGFPYPGLFPPQLLARKARPAVWRISAAPGARMIKNAVSPQNEVRQAAIVTESGRGPEERLMEPWLEDF